MEVIEETATTSQNNNHDHLLSLTTFNSGRKKYRLHFHDNEIKWDNGKKPYIQRILPTPNIFAIKVNSPNRFTIHYVERKKSLWKHNSLTLNHPDCNQVALWVTILQEHLRTRFPHRPKRLLLFINPYGGKKKGMKIFEKQAKPLFDLANVEVAVFVSQKANQICETLIAHDLNNFDSVGCIGGDGTVSEVINGLVLRECRLLQIDPNHPDGELPKPSIPMGIIPGGSTDTTAYCLHGTTDVTTAVLQIILGDCVGLDLVSVHDEERLLRLYADVISYGYLGDISYYSEKLRWMGPTRYEYTGFKKLMANEGYLGEISVLTDPSVPATKKCYENCQECAQKGFLQVDNSKDEEETWKTIRGKFFMVSGANITCAGERNPNGLAPYCHLGDGYLHLLVIYHTTLFNSLLTLHRFTRPNYTTDNLSHVEVYRTKQFRFRAGDSVLRSRWNCDGEVIHDTDIRARVHCQLVKVYTRGIPKST